MDVQPETSRSLRPRVFRTGGVAILAGLVFIVVGLGLTVAAVAIVVLGGIEIPFVLRVGLLVLATVPLAAAGLGVCLTLGGERITIDPQTRQIDIAHGRWWVWKREAKTLDTCTAIHIHREVSTGPAGRDRGANASRRYPVRLLSVEDEIELGAPGEYQRARRFAEDVARLTQLPLHDATEREAVVRGAAELDEPLAARAERLGEQVRWPGDPPDNRIWVMARGEETTIALPPAWKGRLWEGVITILVLMAMYAFALFGLGFVIRHVLLAFEIPADSGFWPAVVWAVPVAPVLYILLLGVSFLTLRESVVVSPRVFRRVWRLPVGRLVKRIPIAEIEEILSDRDDVLLRTDRTTCRVGFSLDKRNRRWLRAAVHYLLVSGPR